MGVTTGLTWLRRQYGSSIPGTINVTSAPYSADNTGSVDASTALQSAFDAAFTSTTTQVAVYVPAGTYKIGKTLLLTAKHNAWVMGGGSGTTTFQFTGNVPPTSSVTITNASPGVVSMSSGNHGYSGGEIVTFVQGSSLPSPLVAGEAYYIKTIVSVTQFTISATSGGAAINTSGGSGTHTILTPLLQLNGTEFSTVDGLTIDISGVSTVGISIDQAVGRTSTSANLFTDIIVKNAVSGVNCGIDAVQLCSENCFVNCTFQDHSFGGIVTSISNALGECIYNCSFARCGSGPFALNYNSAGSAANANSGNIIIIAGNNTGTTFTDSGGGSNPGVDIWSSGAEGKLVIDVTSTSPGTFFRPSSAYMPEPAFEYANNYIFYQNCSFSAPSGGDHGIVNTIGSGMIHKTCTYPDGLFYADGAGRGVLIVEGCTIGRATAVSNYVGNTHTDPGTISTLNIPYAIPDFTCSGSTPPPPPTVSVILMGQACL